MCFVGSASIHGSEKLVPHSGPEQGLGMYLSCIQVLRASEGIAGTDRSSV